MIARAYRTQSDGDRAVPGSRSRARWPLALLLAAAACPVVLPAQQVAGTAAVVLVLPASARSMALGGATAATAGTADAAGLFVNPATLAGDPDPLSLALSAQRHAAGATLVAAAGAWQGRHATVAAGIRALDLGSVEEIVPDPASGGVRGDATGGTTGAGEVAVTLGIARLVRLPALNSPRHRLAVGAAATLVRQRVADLHGTGVTFDAGVSLPLGARGAALGIAAQHLGPALDVAGTRAQLPATVRAGLVAPPLRYGRTALLLSADIIARRARAPTHVLGAEGSWRPGPDVALLARGGVRDRERGDGLSALTFGGGVEIGMLTFDYAFQGADALADGGLHRAGVRWRR